jgi:hypothetical protein
MMGPEGKENWQRVVQLSANRTYTAVGKTVN